MSISKTKKKDADTKKGCQTAKTKQKRGMNVHSGKYRSERSDLPFFSKAHFEPFVDSSLVPSALDLRKEDLIRENLHLRKGDLAQGQSVAEVRNCLRAHCHRSTGNSLCPYRTPAW